MVTTPVGTASGAAGDRRQCVGMKFLCLLLDHSRSSEKEVKHCDFTRIGPSVFMPLSVCLSVCLFVRPSVRLYSANLPPFCRRNLKFGMYIPFTCRLQSCIFLLPKVFFYPKMVKNHLYLFFVKNAVKGNNQ